MINRKILFQALPLLLLLGCHKVSFEDDQQAYVGTWEWVGTTLQRPNMEDYPDIENMMPAIRDFQIEFKDKGVIIVKESLLPHRGRVTKLSEVGNSLFVKSPILSRYTKNGSDDIGLTSLGEDTLFTISLDLIELNFPYPYDYDDEKYYFVRK